MKEFLHLCSENSICWILDYFLKIRQLKKRTTEIHRSQGLSVMPGISSYYQQLRAVGKSGGSWWGDMGRKCPIVWDRVDWYVKILGCLSAPNNPPNPGSDSPCTFKLSPGLHKNKGQSYLPLRERTLAPINEYSIVQNKHWPYDNWLKIWGLQPYQRPYCYWNFDRGYEYIFSSFTFIHYANFFSPTFIPCPMFIQNSRVGWK